MDSDEDLFERQYLSEFNETLSKFTTEINEKLSALTNDINRCMANIVILEKKIENFDHNKDQANISNQS